MYAKDFHRVIIGLPLVWLAKDADQQEKGGGKVEEGHPDYHHNCDGGDCDGEMMIGRRESSREQFGRRIHEHMNKSQNLRRRNQPAGREQEEWGSSGRSDLKLPNGNRCVQRSRVKCCIK